MSKQYQWSINGGNLEIDGSTYTMRVSSRSAIEVYCEVIVKLSNGEVLYGSKNIIVRPNGKAINLVVCV